MDDQAIYDQWYRDRLAQCCEDSASQPGFVERFNQLTGCHFSPSPPPESEDSQQFVKFVDTYIFSAVVDALRKAWEAEAN